MNQFNNQAVSHINAKDAKEESIALKINQESHTFMQKWMRMQIYSYQLIANACTRASKS